MGVLHGAQNRARRDIGVAEVKAVVFGCQAIQGYNAALAERVTDVVIDGLRTPPPQTLPEGPCSDSRRECLEDRLAYCATACE